MPVTCTECHERAYLVCTMIGWTCQNCGAQQGWPQHDAAVTALWAIIWWGLWLTLSVLLLAWCVTMSKEHPKWWRL